MGEGDSPVAVGLRGRSASDNRKELAGERGCRPPVPCRWRVDWDTAERPERHQSRQPLGRGNGHNLARRLPSSLRRTGCVRQRIVSFGLLCQRAGGENRRHQSTRRSKYPGTKADSAVDRLATEGTGSSFGCRYARCWIAEADSTRFSSEASGNSIHSCNGSATRLTICARPTTSARTPRKGLDARRGRIETRAAQWR